jgi:hypothetical protein
MRLGALVSKCKPGRAGRAANRQRAWCPYGARLEAGFVVANEAIRQACNDAGSM